MLIYEIRDTTDDESFYIKGFFATAEEAIEHVSGDDSYQLSDYYDNSDSATLEVYEWELGKWEHETGKRIFKISFTRDFVGESDEDVWKKSIEYPIRDKKTGEK